MGRSSTPVQESGAIRRAARVKPAQLQAIIFSARSSSSSSAPPPGAGAGEAHEQKSDETTTGSSGPGAAGAGHAVEVLYDQLRFLVR